MIIESVHQFWNACRVVPPVDVEYVDVVCLELFQAGFERVLEGLGVHAAVVGLNYVAAFVTFVSSISSGEFRGDDHLISTVALGHPFADPGFRLLILVVASRVDEIATSVCCASAAWTP